MRCPIGLECFEQRCPQRCPNERHCEHLAASWPIPYQIWEIDYFYDKGALIVSIPSSTNWDEVGNSDHEIQAADEYDVWINYIRRELLEAGWENPCELPYFWDEANHCLVITQVHILKGRGEDPDIGFAPAVKIDNWRFNWEPCRTQLCREWGETRREPERDKWGFYLANGVPGLAWHWQEVEDESED